MKLYFLCYFCTSVFYFVFNALELVEIVNYNEDRASTFKYLLIGTSVFRLGLDLLVFRFYYQLKALLNR